MRLKVMDEIGSALAEGEADETLLWAFGGPLPLDELEAWLSTGSMQRTAVLERLCAIRAWMGLPRGDPEHLRPKLAKAVGLREGALRNLVQSWRKAEADRKPDGGDGRSLSLLRLRTEPHRKPVWTKKEEAHRVVKAIISSIETADAPDSKIPVEAVVVKVMEDAGFVELGSNAVRRIIHEVRAARPEELVLGEHVTFDEVALALRDAEGRFWRCTIVLDVGSRLALGAAVVNGTPDARTLATAARSASRYLHSTQLPGIVAADGETRFTVAITDQGAMETLRLFAGQVGWAQQEETPGRLVRATLGPALGRVRIAFGAGAAALEQADLPVVTRKQMVALLSRAMSRHNADLLGQKAETEPTAAMRVRLADLLLDAARTLSK
jgi:hypothetical protein